MKNPTASNLNFILYLFNRATLIIIGMTMHTASRVLSNKFTPSSNLFVMPSFFREMARIVDLWGSLDKYKYSATEALADRKALERDYKIAFADFEKVVREYDRQRQAEEKKQIKS